MRLDLETEIRYPTGERAGILRKLILDETNEISRVVMSTTDLVSRDVLVPVSMLTEDPGGVLTIEAAADVVESLPEYREERLPMVPEGWEIHDDPVPGADIFPATMYEPIVPVVELGNVPEGAIPLSQGTQVWCLDGRWGVVDEVLLDDSGQATAFVARPDDINEQDRIVPVALVQEMDANGVMLNCTLADLPTYTQEITDEHEEPEPR